MTKIEEQALLVAKAWREYQAIDKRISENLYGTVKYASKEQAEEDARTIRPAASRYKAELDLLAQMAL